MIRNSAGALQKTGYQTVFNGRTDNVGAKSANQAISQKRAEAVITWLSAHEVNRARLAAAGFGGTKPVQDNGAEDGRQKNRRVELVKR